MAKDSTVPDFSTFPRDLEGYKWYRPLLTIIIAFILYFVFTVVLAIFMEGAPGMQAASFSSDYENLNATTIQGLTNFLYVVIIIPAVFIANKIVGGRPFTTYLTSRGKWNWEVFFKSFLIGFIIMIIFTVIPAIVQGVKFQVSFTIVTLILAIILVPLQCFAEELACRGLFMQAFGSWFKIPIVAIILSAIVFMLGHEYNSIGMIAILISGIIFGLVAWQMNGIEGSSGLHSANNLTLMLTLGFFQVDPIATNVTMMGLVEDVAITFIKCVALLYIVKKTNWINVE